MICPVCREAMIAVEYQSIELDYCNTCKGVWFDSGELELLLKSQGLGEPGAFFDGILSAQEAASSEKKLKCLLCGRRMRKTTMGEGSKIVIDACVDRHGLWLDGGEVAQVIRHLIGEHPSKRDSGEQVIRFLEEVFKAPQQAGSA